MHLLYQPNTPCIPSSTHLNSPRIPVPLSLLLLSLSPLPLSATLSISISSSTCLLAASICALPGKLAMTTLGACCIYLNSSQQCSTKRSNSFCVTLFLWKPANSGYSFPSPCSLPMKAWGRGTMCMGNSSFRVAPTARAVSCVHARATLRAV
jgi:hypothetical protein